MPLFNPKDLPSQLRRGPRVLGLDWGQKNVGTALSDRLRLLATPNATYPRGKLAALAAALSPLIRKEEVGGLVIGLPLSLDGSFGPSAQAAQDWGRALADLLELPACTWDERLSSSAAERVLTQEADMSRARRARVVDQVAAAHTLQGLLDFWSRTTSGDMTSQSLD